MLGQLIASAAPRPKHSVDENDYHSRGRWNGSPSRSPAPPSSPRSPAARSALRLSHSLPTLIALTGGVVVAVALFDVLPEAFDDGRRPDGSRPGRRRVPRLLPRRAGAGPPSPRRPRAGARPPPGRARWRPRALGPQLHRRARDRARVRPRHDDRGARVHRRGQPRLRRRPEHGQLRAAASPTTAARRKALAARSTPSRRWLGALVGSALTRLGGRRSGELLAVYAGFFIYMGATDLLPEAHGEHARGRGCCSPSPASPRSSRSPGSPASERDQGACGGGPAAAGRSRSRRSRRSRSVDLTTEIRTMSTGTT